jgi:hypothetical protein
MLMSIPTILASGAVLGAEVIADADAQAARDGAIAAAMAFVAAFLALILMMRLLKTVSFTPYVIYRVILGVVLLWLGYSGALTTFEVRRAFLDLGVLPGRAVGPQVILQHQLHRRGLMPRSAKDLRPGSPRCRAAGCAPGPGSEGRCETGPASPPAASNTAAMIPAIQNGTFTISGGGG